MRLAALALTLTMLTPLPAAAQILVYDPVPNSAANKAMHRLAICAAQRRVIAEKLLATLPQTREEHNLAGRLIDPDPGCDYGGGQIEFSVRYMRGGVAEALLEQDFGNLGGKARRKPAALFHTADIADPASLSDESKGSIGMILFGQCVAHPAPGDVAALFGTIVGSSDENAVFKKLSPAMASCAPSGNIPNTSGLQMRGYLAEGAYREAVASEEKGE